MSDSSAESGLPRQERCGGCGTELTPSMLMCPACRRLVHGGRLSALVAEATAAVAAGERTVAMEKYREALLLLPAETGQHAAIVERISALGREVDAGAPAGGSAGSTLKNWFGGRSGWGWASVGLLLVSVLSKGKLLVMGLANLQVVLLMLASAGVYWTVWGWWFAFGLVASIYIHEMGHVFMLRRYGIPASAPMFIPGLGAVIRLRQNLVDVREDCRVGLAGPEWGLAAAIGFAAVGYVLNLPSVMGNHAGDGWLAVAKVGAWINLFNLSPVWSLDGGRAFRAFSRAQRFATIALIVGLWLMSREGLLVLVGLLAVVRVFAEKPPADGLVTGVVRYGVLAAGLTALTLLPVKAG